MLIRNSRPSDVKSSEITGHSVFLNRRRFLETGAAGALALSVPSLLGSSDAQAAALPDLVKTKWGEGLELTDKEDATKYNNFYELSTDKEGPARMAHLFKPKPWKVTVDGEVAKSGEIDFDDLIKPHKLEERIYRLRCVEAWSMVIPWVGIPLGDVLKRFEPTSKAKYVAFETLVDEKMMPGVRYPVVPWPYREGLRMDEAMNPLALLAVGMYGEELLPQNGAPIRLVVPWKYGFKSIKSIVRITLTEKQPPNSWNMILPNEYGFYANVNPSVDHPRWSQANERRIGHFFRQETLMFNGYGEEVAHLYEGMDLRKNY